jgi:predicted DNA-binding protein (MmcQ/YjbR family)
MTRDALNAFCRTLPVTTHVVQWGEADVWKVGGKVFAIIGGTPGQPTVSFKVSEIAFDVLKEQAGLRPAPYLASRGMTWIQHFGKPGLRAAELRDIIRQSHAIVAQGLTKKARAALGLDTLAPVRAPRGKPARRRAGT